MQIHGNASMVSQPRRAALIFVQVLLPYFFQLIRKQNTIPQLPPGSSGDSHLFLIHVEREIRERERVRERKRKKERKRKRERIPSPVYDTDTNSNVGPRQLAVWCYNSMINVASRSDPLTKQLASLHLALFYLFGA